MLKNLSKRRALLFCALGMMLGFLIFIGLRLTLVRDHNPHYHANFAVFIDGERDKLDNFTFYEEVQSCSVHDDNNPKHRVHMHNQENSVIHVHAHAVTWGDFFANLGYGLSDKALTTLDKVYVDGTNGKKLTFLLNGELESFIANRVIKSEDVLLIDYGNGKAAKAEFDAIQKTAGEYNHKPDPAACSGSSGLTFSERLRRALDFSR